jgi:hypothetical protein
MKLLKQKWSGEIYVWTKELAARDDMEDYVKPGVQSEPVQVEQAEIEVVGVEDVVAVEAPAETPKPKKKGK